MIIKTVLILLGLFYFELPSFGQCNGSATCTVCTNCSSCRYCKKAGGSCGVCGIGKNNESKYYFDYKSNPASRIKNDPDISTSSYNSDPAQTQSTVNENIDGNSRGEELPPSDTILTEIEQANWLPSNSSNQVHDRIEEPINQEKATTTMQTEDNISTSIGWFVFFFIACIVVYDIVKDLKN